MHQDHRNNIQLHDAREYLSRAGPESCDERLPGWSSMSSLGRLEGPLRLWQRATCRTIFDQNFGCINSWQTWRGICTGPHRAEQDFISLNVLRDNPGAVQQVRVET